MRRIKATHEEPIYETVAEANSAEIKSGEGMAGHREGPSCNLVGVVHRPKVVAISLGLVGAEDGRRLRRTATCGCTLSRISERRNCCRHAFSYSPRSDAR